MRETANDVPRHSGLFADLYELTMAQAYDAEQMREQAVFELFFRKLPAARNFMMSAGVDDVLASLESFHFTESDLSYLGGLHLFSTEFLARLSNFRFSGEVYAIPEGTLVFPNEPIVQVIAPILEAQLAETMILNQVHFQTIAASKAARVVLAAEGRDVVEFGSRRAHGADAALKVARTSYLAGAVGTSNVLAGKLYDIPVYGTMAHSYVQAHESELEAFNSFASAFDSTTLLVDTYDTLSGVQKVVELARRMGSTFNVRGIRLDSGDLAELAFQSRRLLDNAGLQGLKIFASGGLDEFSIRDIVRRGAPIDVFGVGTKLAVSSDAPALDMAYKLVEYAGQPRSKLSKDKVLVPGRKQIYRTVQDGLLAHDVIGGWEEPLPGQKLLVPMMVGGQRTAAGKVSLNQGRQFARQQLAQLPAQLKQLERADRQFVVSLSHELQRKSEKVQRNLYNKLVIDETLSRRK